MKRKSLSKIKGLDAIDALAPRCQPSPSQENLQDPGLREMNVVKLEWTRVDLEQRRAWIHSDQAKGEQAIVVPLNADAMVVLREQQGQHPQRVFTFKGEPVTRANNHAWRNAL